MIARIPTFAVLMALCVAWAPAPSDPDAVEAPPLPEPVEIGPSIGEAEVALYFTTTSLKSASSELQAGLAMNPQTYIHPRHDAVPKKRIHKMALNATDQARR